MNDYKFVNLQLALFFGGSLSTRSDQLSVEINKYLSDIFNGQPLLFPLPDIAPGEIPFLQLKSKDEAYQCNVARTRADFFFNVSKNTNPKDPASLKSNYSEYLNSFFKLFSSKMPIARVGYITKHFISVQDPPNFIRDKFISKSLGHCDELTIRFNRKRKTENFELNDIIILESAQITDTNEPGILVQRDVNTAKEQQYNFSVDLFQIFVKEAESLFGEEAIKGLVN